MKENPCKPDCPDRSPTCHGTCKKYMEFFKEREEERAKQDIQRNINESFYRRRK